MRKLAIAALCVLLLVGLPVGVAFALAEATGSAWALFGGAAVTMLGSFGLLAVLEMDGVEYAMGGVGFGVPGILGTLVGFDVIAVGPLSGCTPCAVVSLIVAIVALVVAVFGVRLVLG